MGAQTLNNITSKKAYVIIDEYGNNVHTVAEIATGTADSLCDITTSITNGN